MNKSQWFLKKMFGLARTETATAQLGCLRLRIWAFVWGVGWGVMIFQVKQKIEQNMS